MPLKMPGGPTSNLVQLEPADRLTFQKVHNDSQPNSYTSCVTLRLTNKSGGYVAFKVKTTAPKAYLVRPSSGTLGPQGETEVSIILQLSGNDQVSSHRFLVQAASTSSEAPVSKDTWATFDKESVQEQRLSVHLEEAQSQPTSAVHANAPSEPSGAVPEARSREPAQPEAPETLDSLRQKYENLSGYVKTVEKQKEKLEGENRRLMADKSKSRPSGGDGMWSSWSVMLLMSVVVVVVAYLTKASYADRVVPGGAMAEAAPGLQTPPVLNAGLAAAVDVEAVAAGAKEVAAAAAAPMTKQKKETPAKEAAAGETLSDKADGTTA